MSSPSALLISYVWPEIRSSAAGLRTLNLIQTLKNGGWQVHVASHSAETLYKTELQEMGIHTHSVQPNSPDFDLLVQQIAPEVVLYDRFVIEEQFGWRVREHCPKALQILDTQDLHFLRRLRERAHQSKVAYSKIAAADLDFQDPDTLRELSSIYRCDLTLVLSRFEMELLATRFQIPAALLRLSQFHYPPPSGNPPFDLRKGFFWIGNFRHAPNYDSIFWLKNHIWPLIRQTLPQAELQVFGAYPPKQVMDLNAPQEGFCVRGPVENHFELLKRARVNLAPLRFGAGIKGKISDGWACGTPCVTTRIGIEGMLPPKLIAEADFIADDESHFASQAVKLHEDAAAWKRASNLGERALLDFFSAEKNEAELLQAIRDLKSSLMARRAQNWVGQILEQNQFRSTKYFSKWIEEKEKNKKALQSP